MKKCLVLFVVALMLMSLPAMSARRATIVVDHDCVFEVQQAYWGTTPNPVFAGDCAGTGVISPFAVPGILSIDPGVDWANFINAPEGSGTVTVKDVWLFKTHKTDYIQCGEFWNTLPNVVQHGSPAIRLWWPLMYEAPGTEWTLKVTYYTSLPAPAGQTYEEVWHMAVVVDLDSLKALITLFHELPFGVCEVPLISDEELFDSLIATVEAIEDALVDPADLVAASQAVDDFEDLVIDNCLTIEACPPNARPTGDGTGIYNTEENPVCCKLLADIEVIAMDSGLDIYLPGK